MQKYIACKVQEHICEEIRTFSSLKIISTFYISFIFLNKVLLTSQVNTRLIMIYSIHFLLVYDWNHNTMCERWTSFEVEACRWCRVPSADRQSRQVTRLGDKGPAAQVSVRRRINIQCRSQTTMLWNKDQGYRCCIIS